MSEHVQDVTERAKLTGCLVIWMLFLALALVTILCPAANRTILATIAVSILIMAAAWDYYLRWRDDRALSCRVRSELRTERCHRCGGPFDTWDGRFWPVRFCVDYSRPARGQEFRWFRYRVIMKCQSCSKSNEILVWSDGKLKHLEELLGIDVDR
jgi:hypothetical protein